MSTGSKRVGVAEDNYLPLDIMDCPWRCQWFYLSTMVLQKIKCLCSCTVGLNL